MILMNDLGDIYGSHGAIGYEFVVSSLKGSISGGPPEDVHSHRG